MSPRTQSIFAGALVVLGVLALGYGFFVVLQPMLGTAVALACFLGTALVHPRVDAPARQAVTWFAVLVVVAHGVHAGRFLDAVLVAAAVYVAAWLTGPDGPFGAR